MKFIILAAALLACAAAIPITNSLNGDGSHHWFEFGKFVQQHGKSYASVEEFSTRFSIFKNWLNYIESHNSRAEKTYELAVNKFADHTWEEFKSMYLGYRFQNKTRNYDHHLNAPVATAVDWRTKGCVNPVKDQGQCGSCWAFSAIASLECANFQKSGKLPNLSEQQLVDCSGQSGNQGCNGGLMDNAFDYVQKVSMGEDTEVSYPYKARDGKCMFNKANIAGTCSGHTDIATTETALQAAATGRVVSIAIAAEQDFMFYSKGIYDSTTCPTDPDHLNHGVAIVGFDSSAKYWIVRNSWGGAWGEQGYIRMAMGKNLCGLTDAASYPAA